MSRLHLHVLHRSLQKQRDVLSGELLGGITPTLRVSFVFVSPPKIVFTIKNFNYGDDDETRKY